MGPVMACLINTPDRPLSCHDPLIPVTSVLLFGSSTPEGIPGPWPMYSHASFTLERPKALRVHWPMPQSQAASKVPLLVRTGVVRLLLYWYVRMLKPPVPPPLKR